MSSLVAPRRTAVDRSCGLDPTRFRARSARGREAAAVLHSCLTVEVGRFPISRRQRILGVFFGLAALVGLVLVNELVFRTALDNDYPRWYLDNGAAIGLVFTLITLAWGDINRNRLLISANPLEYAGSWLALLTAPWLSLAAMIRPDRSEWKAKRKWDELEASGQVEQSLTDLKEALAKVGYTIPDEDEPLEAEIRASDPASREAPAARPEAAEPLIVPRGLPVVDVVVAMLFALTFAVATLAWLLFVVPLQYFLYLVTAAPARVACASPTRASVEMKAKETIYGETLKSDALAEGAMESGFSAKPVTFTAAITTAVLFAVSQLI